MGLNERSVPLGSGSTHTHTTEEARGNVPSASSLPCEVFSSLLIKVEEEGVILKFKSPIPPAEECLGP